ncbi:MAG: CotH kinase family protein, partial [Saprospiraceae bacterium]|nr:CotH kinase family protein [Saprospiraceae bacterium]
DMNDPVKFQYVKDRYDYTSLIDYVIANSFTVCTDWLNYNTGLWRGLNPEGAHQRWGYILWDNDATFDHYINYTGLPSTQADAEPCNPESLTGGSDPQRHIQVLNKLRTNPEVQQYYLSRQADLMYTVFGCENMLNYLDTIEALIDPEMARHAQRWFGTYQEWKNNLEDLREFITQRCELLPELMDDCYQVTGPYQATILVDPPGAGKMQINTLHYEAGQFPVNGHYFGGQQVDLLLHAAAVDTNQYRFDHWSAKNHSFADSSLAAVALDIASADTIVAHFKQLSTPVVELETSAPVCQVNPTVFSNEINVNFFLPEQLPTNLQLYDVVGNLAWQQAISKNSAVIGTNSLKIQLKEQALPPGVYFFTFNAGQFYQTFKLIKI